MTTKKMSRFNQCNHQKGQEGKKTLMGKCKRRMPKVVDLTSTFTNIFSNISDFMSSMNSHLKQLQVLSLLVNNMRK